MSFSPIEDAVEAIRKGNIVLVVDAEDRENEGDFVCAADTITADMANFMLKARGVFCVTLGPDHANRLELTPATEKNTALNSTAFTVSVDLRTGSTGVSAAERADTARALTDDKTRATDLARPGHVYPIIGQEGGVLRRAGHTEASIDLVTLAGLKPVGVLIEILDEDGKMARRDRLRQLAREHGMPIVTIADLIRYRHKTEKLVHREAICDLPTHYGEFRVYGYSVAHENDNPLAFVMGDLQSTKSPLVRMHSACFTGDVLESIRCECGDQLHIAMHMIAKEGVGAVVYLPQEGRGIGLLEKIKAYALQDEGLDTVEANHVLGHRADSRDYGIGIQILKDLGLSEIRLLTNNPKKTSAVVEYGYDLKVTDQVPLIAPPRRERRKYLQTKRDKLGHLLPPDDLALQAPRSERADG